MFDRESRRRNRLVGLGVGLVLLFFVSASKSCTELRYSLSGETTHASIRKTVEFEGKIVVRYDFKDHDDRWRKGSFRIEPSEWERPADNRVEIIYLPSNPDVSTSPKVRSMAYPAIFGVLMLAIAGWAVWLAIETKRVMS